MFKNTVRDDLSFKGHVWIAGRGLIHSTLSTHSMSVLERDEEDTLILHSSPEFPAFLKEK